jgi:drug/metabolite transporter (DMT)-like permease
MPGDSALRIPPHCLVGSATGVGAALLFATYHSKVSRLPATCIAGTLAAAGTLGSVLAHHHLSKSVPPVQCWIGSGVFLGGLYYVLTSHAQTATAASTKDEKSLVVRKQKSYVSSLC